MSKPLVKQPHVKRLVLGFDGGCGTCLELAKKIDEQVGDRLEVQNLRDPQLVGWRSQALGEDAPWAPTLFEVKGEKIRAWTGKRMGAKLTRFLGPVATWKVMQVLGEMGAPAVTGESLTGKVAAGMSRGRFLKGVGGAMVAFSVLSGFEAGPAQAVSGGPRVRSSEEITDTDLIDMARRHAAKPDMVNVQGQAWSDGMQTYSVIESCQNGEYYKVFTGGSCTVRRVNGDIELSGNCTAVRARRHELYDGNFVYSVSFLRPNDVVMFSHHYREVTSRGLKTRIGRYQLENGRWRARRNSVNGRLMEQADGRFSATATCGDCYDPSARPYYSEFVCDDFGSARCYAAGCASCAGCNSPLGVGACAFCAFLCPTTYWYCCEAGYYDCALCGGK